MTKKNTNIKTTQQIDNIAEAGKHLTEILYRVYDAVQPGVPLLSLEKIAADYLAEYKLKGAFKGYNGFPTNLCLSVNDCIVHGIPDNYLLANGDLLKIDCGVEYKKCIADSAISVVVGGEFANPEHHQLVHVTKEALDLGIKQIKPGNTIYDYSQVVYKHINDNGMSVLGALTGHGVGNALHEPPFVYNYPHPDGKKTKFVPGMVVAIEPITALQSVDFHEKPGNHWNLYTSKGDAGAQWEYTIVITEDGNKVLSGITENLGID